MARANFQCRNYAGGDERDHAQACPGAGGDAYAGPIFHDGLSAIRPQLKIEIVKRSDTVKGFGVLPGFKSPQEI